MLVLIVAVCGFAVWSLWRSHFVGAEQDGHVVVYQGLPWNIVGSVKLYRPVYVSPLLTAQLSQAERQKLSTTPCAATTRRAPRSGATRADRSRMTCRNRELANLVVVGALTALGFASVYIARQDVVSTASLSYAALLLRALPRGPSRRRA